MMRFRDLNCWLIDIKSVTELCFTKMLLMLTLPGIISSHEIIPNSIECSTEKNMDCF